MRVSRDRPPIYDEIAEVFDIKGKPVIFAWGDVIFAPPPNGPVLPHLLAHEGVHGIRQRAFPGVSPVVDWWRKYLYDAEFRLEEEKLAHIAEYQNLIAGANRAQRRRHLSHVAARLSASLYRYSITKDEARRVLEHGHAGN